MSRSKRQKTSQGILRRLWGNRDGVVTTELALAFPLFLTLIAGITEIGNFLLLNLKLQHTVVSVADLTTRDDEITEAVMSDIFEAIPLIMAPYPTMDASRLIVSSVSQSDTGNASVFWQRISPSTLNVTSDIGVQGGLPNLPDTLTMRDNETIIVTEYFYSYTPLVFRFIPSQTIRRVAYFRPRLGSLQEILP